MVIQDSTPIALLAGLDSGTVEACLRLLGEEFRFLVADSSEESLRLLAAQPVAVLALGAGVSGERALRLIEEADGTPEGTGGIGGAGNQRRVNLVLAGGPDPSLFQELIDRDRVFYLSQEPVPAGDLIALLRSATVRWRSTAPREDEGERRRSSFARRVFAATQAIATQRQPTGVARAAAEGVEELARADRGYCLLYDRNTDTLWEPPRDADVDEERRETAAVGLVSFVLRTGKPLVLDHLGSDPRFDRDADDPKSQGDERFLAVPVPSPDGRVLAVLAGVRTAAEAPFSEEDLQALTLLAEQSAAAFAQLGLAEGDNNGLPAAALFREEAVEYHQVGLRSEGDVLRVDPGWMRWTYRLLLAALVAGILFSVLAKVREYASGPAVVRLAGRSDLTATADGTVSQITVAAGQKVAAGDLLVRFYGAREAAELARIDREMELQLVNRLRDPSDAGAEQALLSLRAQRELAKSNVSEREVTGAHGRRGGRPAGAGGAAHPARADAAVARPWDGWSRQPPPGRGAAAGRVPAASQTGHAAAPGASRLPLRLPAPGGGRGGRRGRGPGGGAALPGGGRGRRRGDHRPRGEGGGAPDLRHLRVRGAPAPLPRRHVGQGRGARAFRARGGGPGAGAQGDFRAAGGR